MIEVKRKELCTVTYTICYAFNRPGDDLVSGPFPLGVSPHPHLNVLNIESPPMSFHQYVYHDPCFFVCTVYLISADGFLNALRYNRLMYSTPPIESRVIHHFDTSDVLQAENVVFCDKRTSCVPCLQLWLIVWAGPVTIDALPHDVLQHIFRLGEQDSFNRRCYWRWDRLVHVCHSWRSIIFASPNVLNLKLVRRPWSRMDPTGIWPPLPFIVAMNYTDHRANDSFDAVTVNRNRVCEIHLRGIRGSQMHRLASAMRGQFPALIHLSLTCDYFDQPSSLPDGFLDGSAPLLQSLKLRDFGFSALPNFLLSASHLVRLTFEENRNNECIPPEKILNCLTVLSKLKSLTLKIDYFPSPDWENQHAPPPTFIVLPVLTHFEFDGYIGYLEALVARIDAPLLDSIRTTSNVQSTSDFSQLARFMRRSTCFQPPNEIHVDFRHIGMQVRSFPPRRDFGEGFRLKISCSHYWDSSPLVQGFASLLPSIHMVDELYIYSPSQHSSPGYDGYMKFFYLLTSVKNLYISSELAESIAFELTDYVGERVSDVLPALECILLEDLQPSGFVHERIGQFAAARQLLGRPAPISTWNKTGDHFEF